ncbi:MAG: methylated-DNA--[protein]-cysteine S-methyltransferase [Pseudomonadota bacterium]
MSQLAVQTPVGTVVLHEEAGRICHLEWTHQTPTGSAGSLLKDAARQIAEYFDGRRTQFDLPIDGGTGRQAAFSEALMAIPMGETRTYGALARDLGLPAQAIGQLCGRNPVPILIPCHRVLGADGLGGFSALGGIETKVALLRHEGAASLLI